IVSPSSRQAEMSKKSTSSLLERTRLTASPKEHTGIPSLVNLSSGSLVRLPANTTRLKLTTDVPPYLVPTSLTIQEHARFSSDETLAGRLNRTRRVTPQPARRKPKVFGVGGRLMDPSGAPGVACILILPGACRLQGMLQAVV